MSSNDKEREYHHLGEFDHNAGRGGMSTRNKKPEQGLLRRIWWWFKPDWLFLFLLAGSVFILVVGGLKAEPSNFVPPPLFPKLLLLMGATVILAALATLGAKLDRRKLDDYLFQMITNGAVIGIITTIFVKALWEMGDNFLPAINSDDLMAVMIGSWSLGYFFYRWRGLNS